mgnify:CR=1 FL=1|jgi:hypothetical protein
MNKVEFVTRIEAAKAALPNSVVPLFIKKWPKYDTQQGKTKVTNVVQGKVQSENILLKLEQLVEILKPI